MIDEIFELLKEGAITDNRLIQIEKASNHMLFVTFETGEQVMLLLTRMRSEHDHDVVPQEEG